MEHFAAARRSVLHASCRLLARAARVPPIIIANNIMPLFAIQWALVVCNVISSLTAIPGVVFGVETDQFHSSMERFFDRMPAASDQKLLKLMMKFLFGGLLFVYILGIFAAFYCPTVIIGYMFGAGDFLRVALILVWIYADAEKYAMTGFGNQLKVTCHPVGAWPRHPGLHVSFERQ